MKNSFLLLFYQLSCNVASISSVWFLTRGTKSNFRLWFHESFISINFFLWWGIFCKAMHFSSRTPHSLQLCVRDFYSCRFLHIVTELCWPVRMKSLCVSGRVLSSRPEFSWEMSLCLRVLCCGLHFFIFCCGKNLQNVNQKSRLQCKNILVIVSVLEIPAIYPVQDLLM